MGCGRQLICFIIWCTFMFAGQFNLGLLFAAAVVLAITRNNENG